jgi:YebC/PmpR family DNA-binding regulatory protein
VAGHSHAKNIKIRKAAVDSKRSRIFTKLSRLITIAAREGGGDVKLNAKLAFAVGKAKEVSLPKDTIERAIRKGTGEEQGEAFEEVVYEGYGPAGVAIMCDILTDNRNRTAGEVRKIFDVHGGNLGSTNCVAYLFQRKGQILIESAGRNEDAIMELALESGADDFKTDGDYFVILTEPSQFNGVVSALSAKGITPTEADIVRLAETQVTLEGDVARKVAKLLDALDDNDDVQNVFSNASLPEEAFGD